MMCWWCLRRRAAAWLPLAALVAGLVWVVYLAGWDRPMVACGTEWQPSTGQVTTLYCRATQPVWP